MNAWLLLGLSSLLASSESSSTGISDIVRLLLLQDYNTRIVVIGTTMLGLAAGMVGSFTLLRKRALMGDALSHATLPGICLAFLVSVQLGWSGKSLLVLLIGATLSGLLGVASILALRQLTKLKEDTAIGAILSVFFGAGISLLGMIQNMQAGHAAGLESFIYGKTASMGFQDIQLISWVACISILGCWCLFKEFKLLCFDEEFAVSRGFPVLVLDMLLMGMVILITIVGLQAVGLVLMIALLVIPAASARFWTEELWQMFLISGILGAFSCLVGSGVSALFAKLPSGPMIVLFCTLGFLISMIFGTERGILGKTLRRLRLNQNIDRQHLLRGVFEKLETLQDEHHKTVDQGNIHFQDLLVVRSWSKKRLRNAIEQALSDRLIDFDGQFVSLTKRGLVEAKRLTHQHRLWELYLITHADIAPGRVDREADDIEHVLEPEIILELEALLKKDSPYLLTSPHQIEAASTLSGVNRSPFSALKEKQDVK